jgi:ABC-type glycerol-3-phosphate transport system permease component
MLTARRRTTAAEQRGTNEESTRLSVVIVLRAALGTYLPVSMLGRFPREIVEAAHIDGANTWLFFVRTWNEFLLPLMMPCPRSCSSSSSSAPSPAASPWEP